MTRSTLDDAFGHHVWATLTLFDTCATLSDEQLRATASGTYGTILDTMRHIVGADRSYLHTLTEGRASRIDEERMDLGELRAAMEEAATGWTSLLADDPDPERELVRHRDDGSSTGAPISIRLAQALHHGTDHRSQVCTILTTIGVEPPGIDVWDYAWKDDRLTETPPTS